MYQVIKQLKNGKSAGPNSIPPEALKADVETSVELLYPLFKKIWEEKQVPSQWKQRFLIKLPKKGMTSAPLPVTKGQLYRPFSARCVVECS